MINDYLGWASTHLLANYAIFIGALTLIALAGKRTAWYASLPIRLLIAATVIAWMVWLVRKWQHEDAATLGYTPTMRATIARVWQH